VCLSLPPSFFRSRRLVVARLSHPPIPPSLLPSLPAPQEVNEAFVHHMGIYSTGDNQPAHKVGEPFECTMSPGREGGREGGLAGGREMSSFGNAKQAGSARALAD